MLCQSESALCVSKFSDDVITVSSRFEFPVERVKGHILVVVCRLSDS